MSKLVGAGISIHALREEGDRQRACGLYPQAIFLSTPSARRATAWFAGVVVRRRNFYPRPPRGGRPAPLLFYHISLSISIHALREEGDVWQSHPASAWSNFYPRPPRGGRRHRTGSGSQSSRFLSTPSARRATVVCARFELLDDDFYPRPPRGGRRMDVWTECYRRDISIHALREEGDRLEASSRNVDGYFYPRPPRGGRPRTVPSLALMILFLSTPSARRATIGQRPRRRNLAISIHALREEGDRLAGFDVLPLSISIHALREEGDPFSASTAFNLMHFYPRPPRGGRLLPSTAAVPHRGISIHALREEGDQRKRF